MSYNTILISIILFALVILEGASSRRAYSVGDCNPDKLTVYRVHFNTWWDREDFPKQYPEWRPPAQWSKLIGRSHDRSYVLFHIGKPSSEGMKLFSESGNTDVLEDESQGEGGIFDEFNAPPITEGVGESDAEFFVYGNHSLVSLASRIVPSPDWFVGISSFDLCVEGSWVESVTLEVGPLDAGTDNGFTFTSPNWPTVPQKPISKITATEPDHPANSFFYPDRDELPPLATINIMKVKEYELSKVFDPTLPQKSSRKPYKVINRKANEINYNSDSGYEVSNDILPVGDAGPPYTPLSPAHSKHALYKSLVKKYRKKFKKNRKGRKMATRRHRAPRDCRVSEWNSWSPCSQTCGIGEQTRKRKVLKHSRRGGRPCPLMEENKWCGSSRDCSQKYFDW